MTPLLLALPLVLAAPVPKDFKKVGTDLQAVQGEWEEVERCNYGNKQPIQGTRYVIRGNTLKIVPTRGTPREVKWTLDETDKTYVWEAPWGTWIGRYKLEGDRLIRASVKQGKPLPDEVAPGPTVEYSIYKRARK